MAAELRRTLKSNLLGVEKLNISETDELYMSVTTAVKPPVRHDPDRGIMATSHSDTYWRVAAIYRCAVRYGKGRDWCLEKMSELYKRSAEGKIIEGSGFTNLVDIWFRLNDGGRSHIDLQREEYRHGLAAKLEMALRVEAFVARHDDGYRHHLSGLEALNVKTLMLIDEAMAKADTRIAELEAEIVALHEDAAGADI